METVIFNKRTIRLMPLREHRREHTNMASQPSTSASRKRTREETPEESSDDNRSLRDLISCIKQQQVILTNVLKEIEKRL